MSVAVLITRKVLHFLAVLFLGSLVLGALLWVSPGSPGRPRDPLPLADLRLGETRACFGPERCGVVVAAVDPATDGHRLDLGGVVEDAPHGSLLVEPPGFWGWFLGRYWGGLLRGDVGTAYNDEPVISVVSFAAKQTLPIVAGAILFSVTWCLAGVWFLAWLPFPSLRGVLRTAILAVSMSPVFILGYVLTKAGVLPHPTLEWVAPAACVVLLAVGDSHLGELLLQLEDEVRQLRARDYVHAAGLRGASVLRHMAPGILLPLTSLVAAKIAFLLGSVVIAENIYAVQGLGALSLKAATKPDPILLLTITVLIMALVGVVGLIRDVVEIAIDPRIRRGTEAS